MHSFISKAHFSPPGGQANCDLLAENSTPTPEASQTELAAFQRKINLKMQNRFLHPCVYAILWAIFGTLIFQRTRSSRLIATRTCRERTQCPGKGTSGIDSKLGFSGSSVTLCELRSCLSAGVPTVRFWIRGTFLSCD